MSAAGKVDFCSQGTLTTTCSFDIIGLTAAVTSLTAEVKRLTAAVKILDCGSQDNSVQQS
jgi:hypothetical protein